MKLELTRFKPTKKGIKEKFERMQQMDFNESSAKVHDVMTKK